MPCGAWATGRRAGQRLKANLVSPDRAAECMSQVDRCPTPPLPSRRALGPGRVARGGLGSACSMQLPRPERACSPARPWGPSSPPCTPLTPSRREEAEPATRPWVNGVQALPPNPPTPGSALAPDLPPERGWGVAAGKLRLHGALAVVTDF